MRQVKMLLAILAALLISAVPAFGAVEVLHQQQAEGYGQTRFGKAVYDKKATQKDKARNAWEFVRPGYVVDHAFIFKYIRPHETAVVVRCRITDEAQSKVGLRLYVNGKDAGEKVIRPTAGGRRYVDRVWKIGDIQAEAGSGGVDAVDTMIKTTRMNVQKEHDGILIDNVKILGIPTEGGS
jgi:hypothetical protein